jgi:hypothetical protein
MTFKPAHKDTVNPPGQIRNELTLGDYIDRKTMEDRKKFEKDLTEYQRGYLDGYYDAHVKIKAGE